MSTLACPLIAMLLILVGQSQGEDPKPPSHMEEVKQLDGLWSGSWGGGDRDGVVFQPVVAEILIDGEKFELHGFKDLNQAWGLIRIDPATKKFKITTAKTVDAPSKVWEYTYKITNAGLTLIDADNIAIDLHKVGLQSKPLVTVRMDILIAEGINETGQLMTTEQAAVKVGKSTSIRYQPSTVARTIDDSAIFVTEADGLKKISINDARKLLKPPRPVAMAYRETDAQMLKWDIGLRHFQGAAKPESEAGLRTLATLLRPGTLVFIVSELHATPEP